MRDPESSEVTESPSRGVGLIVEDLNVVLTSI